MSGEYNMKNAYHAVQESGGKKRSKKDYVREDSPKPKKPTPKEQLMEMKQKMEYYKNLAMKKQIDEFGPHNTEDYYAVQYKGKSVKVTGALTHHLKPLFDNDD
jgi:hypothetical protein